MLIISNCMSQPAIEVLKLSKRFIIHHEQTDKQRYQSLRDVISSRVKNMVRREELSFSRIEEFWALREVSFKINQGERVGVIGRNGAGKSTLLKILSRITEPSHGSVRIRGRVASLLEVGTGFHPELTGRENIFLNGAILGMTRAEVRQKFDEIVAFAEVEKFLDTPVKRYSSGMYVRLAFAVAANLEPEILIVDEVLAVGDAEFQKKCLGKMEDVSKHDGRTVIFVSHNMAAIENLCKTAILLDKGSVAKTGNVRDVTTAYQNRYSGLQGTTWLQTAPASNLCFTKVELSLQGCQPNYSLKIQFSVTSLGSHKKAFVAFDISNSLGITIMQALPTLEPFINNNVSEQYYSVVINLPPLIPDRYLVSAWCGPHFSETLSWEKEIISFEIIDSPTAGRNFPHSVNNGFIVPTSYLIENEKNT